MYSRKVVYDRNRSRSRSRSRSPPPRGGKWSRSRSRSKSNDRARSPARSRSPPRARSPARSRSPPRGRSPIRRGFIDWGHQTHYANNRPTSARSNAVPKNNLHKRITSLEKENKELTKNYRQMFNHMVALDRRQAFLSNMVLTHEPMSSELEVYKKGKFNDRFLPTKQCLNEVDAITKKRCERWQKSKVLHEKIEEEEEVREIRLERGLKDQNFLSPISKPIANSTFNTSNGSFFFLFCGHFWVPPL